MLQDHVELSVYKIVCHKCGDSIDHDGSRRASVIFFRSKGWDVAVIEGNEVALCCYCLTQHNRG